MVVTKGFKPKALEDAGAHVSKKAVGVLPDQFETVLISIRVPHALRAKWKRAALDRDTTMTELVIDAMQRALDKQE